VGKVVEFTFQKKQKLTQEIAPGRDASKEGSDASENARLRQVLAGNKHL
jgi:hypothetical protein